MPEESMRDAVLKTMQSPKYRPLTSAELARDLNVPSADRVNLRRVLADLVKEGKVIEGRKSKYELRGQSTKSANLLSGVLRFHPKGHAWFFPQASDPENLATGIDLRKFSRIYIGRRDCSTALDGDSVVCSIQLPSERKPLRRGKHATPAEEPEGEAKGRVERILERRSGRLVGVFREKGKHRWVESDDQAIDGSIEITRDTTAQAGQLVVVELEHWESRRQSPRGRILEVLGWPGDPGTDILAVIQRFGLRTTFPEAVLREVHDTPEDPSPEEISRREDWRKPLVITIDPADAKDHDDAIWLEKTSYGWQLAVHIADVSHYVKPGTALDKEAVERGNSTYLVDRVLPMLPPELSNGICSLKPNVDRLTKCALIDLGSKGEVRKVRFFDAVIHSRAKLSYEQAQTILDGGNPPEGSEAGLADMVREGWRMASTLRRRRFDNGALDLEMPEVRIKLDEQGRACGLMPVEHTASHQLIEECMLIANEVVAQQLKRRQKPALYRIHEDPDFSKLNEFAETARMHGYHPGDLSNRVHIQKLIDEAKGSPEEHAIKLGLLKSLKRAAYSPDGIGHFGLAKEDYCHFTSPIRRYADLIIHRALQPFLDNAPKRADRTPTQAELASISQHISDTERTSAEAENETRQIKMMEFLGRVAELEEPIVFDGLITEARPMGLFVEIPDLGIRGAVKREDLPTGSWRFEGHRGAWTSFGGETIRAGMRLPMEVIGIDRIRRFVDFRIAVESMPASGLPTPAKGKSAPPAKPSRPPKPQAAKRKADHTGKPFRAAKVGGKSKFKPKSSASKRKAK